MFAHYILFNILFCHLIYYLSFNILFIIYHYVITISISLYNFLSVNCNDGLGMYDNIHNKLVYVVTIIHFKIQMIHIHHGQNVLSCIILLYLLNTSSL